MIPIRDTIPARHTAWLVRGVVALNLGVFVWELFQGPALTRWIYHFGVTPVAWAVTRLAALWEWPRLALSLFTSQFLHGGLLHVA